VAVGDLCDLTVGFGPDGGHDARLFLTAQADDFGRIGRKRMRVESGGGFRMAVNDDNADDPAQRESGDTRKCQRKYLPRESTVI